MKLKRPFYNSKLAPPKREENRTIDQQLKNGWWTLSERVGKGGKERRQSPGLNARKGFEIIFSVGMNRSPSNDSSLMIMLHIAICLLYQQARNALGTPGNRRRKKNPTNFSDTNQKRKNAPQLSASYLKKEKLSVDGIDMHRSWAL